MSGWSPLAKSGHAPDIRICLRHSLLCGFHCPVDWKNQLYTLFYVAVQHLLVQVSLESETLLSLVTGPNKTSEAMSVNFPVCPMWAQSKEYEAVFLGSKEGTEGSGTLGRSEN